MSKLYKSDTASAGVWRGLFVSVDESNRSCQVYIPMLHRGLNPFKSNDPKEGVVSNLSNYPTAQFSCPGVFVTPEVGDTCWVMFEQGDMNFPVVVGQIGTALPEGDVTTAIYGGGGGASSTAAGGGVGIDGYLTGCDKYTLDDSTIEWIATCVTGETGGTDLLACRQEASQMANLHETHYGKSGRDSSSIRTTVRKASQGGWYADDSWEQGVTDTARQAVKDVFIEGNRYLPRYICNHDTFPLDVISPIKDRSQYTRGEQITTKYTSDAYFYCFFGSDQSGDIAMYCQSCYAKRKDDDAKMTQSASTGNGSASKAVDEMIKICNAGYPYGRGPNQYDCSSSVCEALHRAGILPNSGSSYNTTSFGTNGSEFLKYGFVDVTSSVWSGGSRSDAKLQPGDILWCYGDHMAMYLGNGKESGASSAHGIRIINYYEDSRITHVFRYSGGSK